MDFWRQLDKLFERSELVIDRPRGSAHPRYPDTIYTLDYGYVVDTSGGDGNEIDVWRGSLQGELVTGVVCTVDQIKRDAEVKLLVGCTSAEMDVVIRFHNDGDAMAAIAVNREGGRG